MTVRPATKEDKNQILSLQDELLVAAAKAKNKKPTHRPVHEVGSKLFDETFDDKTVRYFVAEDNKKIVGLATFVVYPIVRRGQYRGKLEELVVSEDMRGKGIGAMLLKYILKYCKNNNIATMTLCSELDMVDSHRFYENHGGKFTEKMFRFDIK